MTEEMIEIKVTPGKELFYSEDTSFGIYSFGVDFDDLDKVTINKYGNITGKGFCPKLDIGQEYRVTLKEYDDPKYGKGYTIESVKKILPTTVDGQKEFLRFMVSEQIVENIFHTYPNQDVIKLIVDGSFDYNEVRGLGEKTFTRLKNKIVDNLEMQEALVWLGKYGIKYNMIAKLVKEYKSPLILIQKLEENPYLLTKANGFGFLKADSIARQMGISSESPHRIKSCIVHCIKQENINGNSYIEKDALLQESQQMLSINKSIITKVYDDFLIEKNSMIVEINGNKVSLFKIYNAEKCVASRLVSMFRGSYKIDFDVDAFLNKYMDKHGVSLTHEQRKMFQDFCNYNTAFFIGNAGTGKSFSQKILLDMLDELKMSYLLLASTGKASKILSNYVGRPASTAHRALSIHDVEDGDAAEVNEDVVIVDESSMCDVYLVEKILTALQNPAARVVFIGDDFQLPSVQVGNFLYDCIHSDVLNISRLTEVFRQKEGGVLDIATKIRQQEKFIDNEATGRMYFGKDMILHLAEQEHLVDGYQYYYKKMLKQYDSDDIMIVTPTRKGKLGTVKINSEIQKIVNPQDGTKIEYIMKTKEGEVIFRVGDKVMNIVNTYNLEVDENIHVDIFNGDSGRVVAVDHNDKKLYVDFDDIKNVPFKFSDVKNLIHCWAITIHKSQGSSAPVVIMIADKSHTYQLNTNLLYTGVTRTSEKLILLSQAKTINSSLRKVEGMKRKSFLLNLIREIDGLDETS